MAKTSVVTEDDSFQYVESSVVSFYRHFNAILFIMGGKVAFYEFIFVLNEDAMMSSDQVSDNLSETPAGNPEVLISELKQMKPKAFFLHNFICSSKPCVSSCCRTLSSLFLMSSGSCHSGCC